MISSTLISLFSLISLSSAATTENWRRKEDTSSCTLQASGGDDGPLFVAAVKACSVVDIPANSILSIQTRLDMTGLSSKQINLEGTIKFSDNLTYWKANAFYYPYQTQISFWQLGGKDITLSGSGTLDGSGQAWYKAFSSNDKLLRPIILTILNGTNILVQGIHYLNSPEWNNLVSGSKNVTFRNIDIRASSTDSSIDVKNTDGWNLYQSDQIVIRDSVINNQDDCVSWKPNSTNVLVDNLDCTGSHGLSIGSLGQYPGIYDLVENVTISNIKIANASNGARIKAWAGPNVGSGLVRNITFINFQETNVDSPVVIDQCYSTSAEKCKSNPSNTYIQDIKFQNFAGTSSGKKKAVVINLSCSSGGRCSNIIVNGPISLTPPQHYGPASYVCANIKPGGTASGLFTNCTTT